MQTITTTTSTTYSLPLTGAVTPPQLAALAQEPLQPNGALRHARERLTPAIGIQFTKELQFKELLNMEDKQKQALLFKDLAHESE